MCWGRAGVITRRHAKPRPRPPTAFQTSAIGPRKMGLAVTVRARVTAGQRYRSRRTDARSRFQRLNGSEQQSKPNCNFYFVITWHTTLSVGVASRSAPQGTGSRDLQKAFLLLTFGTSATSLSRAHARDQRRLRRHVSKFTQRLLEGEEELTQSRLPWRFPPRRWRQTLANCFRPSSSIGAWGRASGSS